MNTHLPAPRPPQTPRLEVPNGSTGYNTWMPHTWPEGGPSQTIPGFSHFEAAAQKRVDFDRDSVDDELTAMSNTLLGQQFLEMDRVITFDGTNFAMDMNEWQNMG